MCIRAKDARCLSNARGNPQIATRNASCPRHLGAVVNPTVVCAEDSPFEAVPTIVAVYSVAGARLDLSQVTVCDSAGLLGQLGSDSLVVQPDDQ